MPRILVVDDDDEAASILAELLATGGHDATIAACGPEALDALARTRADVLIVNVGLPPHDGYAVARAARRRPDGGPVIIALGGFSGAEAVAAAHDAGCNLHLVKPAALEEVEEAIRRLSPGDGI